MKKPVLFIYLSSLLFLGLFMGFLFRSYELPVETPQEVLPPKEEPTLPAAAPILPQNPLASQDDALVIISVGDIMVHESQWLSQEISPGMYDFTNNFTYVKEVIAKGDLCIANLETTINEDLPLTSYPVFNSPKELLTALKEAGFNLISTANNHSMDYGKRGIHNTLNALSSAGLSSIGTYEEQEKRPFEIFEKKGMRVGIGSYATGYMTGDQVVVNAISSNGMENMVNYISATDPVKAFERIRVDLAAMKAAQVDFILLILHWGNEYEKTPHIYQETLGQLLIDEGVGFIIGSHPHVVQEMTFVNSTSGTQEGLIAYSHGNFLSNQRNEILELTGTEDGLLSRVVLKRDSQGMVYIHEASYLPTWVHRKDHPILEDRYLYEILPLSKDPNRDATIYEAPLEKLQESLENTLPLMKDPKISHLAVP